MRAALGRLAGNYAWTYDPTIGSALHGALAERWSPGSHPLAAVDALTARRLGQLAKDEAITAAVDAAIARLDQMEHDDEPIDVAYFSPEFGVSETLPQYSGGLGILAGDHLKAASDLDLPLVGVGLFYANGYFTQNVAGGKQKVSYDTYKPGDLGLADTGVVISVDTPRGPIRASVWLARVGSVRLYLLDSRVRGNARWARAVTDKLYGGDQQKRIDQEWLLGVGGWRALRALGVNPAIVHLNEGHAGFLLLELLAEQLAVGKKFKAACRQVRSRTLFTTHTPVPAGIDRFPRDLLGPYLEQWSARTAVGVDKVWPVGLLPSDDDPDTFNMAAFCLNLSGMANGVARLHGEVSRELFDSLPAGAKITSVTNGVHARTWVHPTMQRLFDNRLGGKWANGGKKAWARADSIGDDDVRSVRTELRGELVEDLKQRGFTGLSPDALTIGFARRFATYKRAALLLREREALIELLNDDERPVQFVFAGKAHPADKPGQAMLAEIAEFAASDDARGRFVLVPGYDMHLASLLYAGCDVWLNNPVRPQEACGTSGEKAALNGGLNCSIEDGWWAEWSHPGNGWSLPTSDLGDPEARDAAEAAGLMNTLADKVAPEFFDPDGSPFSDAWLARIRKGWTYLGPRVTAGRMVAEYRDRLYTPLMAGTLKPGRLPKR